MEFSIRRVNALLKKEMKDFVKNPNVLIMFILPISFAFMYSRMLGDKLANDLAKVSMLNMCIGMSFTMVGVFVVAMMIAEEKEKNTLRTLMLSGVSPVEFMFGKVLITFIATMIINIAIFFMLGVSSKYLGIFILLSVLVGISMMLIGGIIGILSKDQMSTGIVGMPVLMVLLILPMLSQTLDNNIIKTLGELIPNAGMNTMLLNAVAGNAFSSMKPLIVILAWIIISAGLFAYSYKKKGLDR